MRYLAWSLLYVGKTLHLEAQSMSNATSCTTPVPQLLKPHEVAKLLGVSRRTLAYWRARRTGPAWVDVTGGLGRKPCIRYSLADLEAWIKENTKRTAS